MHKQFRICYLFIPNLTRSSRNQINYNRIILTLLRLASTTCEATVRSGSLASSSEPKGGSRRPSCGYLFAPSSPAERPVSCSVSPHHDLTNPSLLFLAHGPLLSAAWGTSPSTSHLGHLGVSLPSPRQPFSGSREPCSTPSPWLAPAEAPLLRCCFFRPRYQLWLGAPWTSPSRCLSPRGGERKSCSFLCISVD